MKMRNKGHIITTYKIRDQCWRDRAAQLQTSHSLWHSSLHLFVTVSKSCHITSQLFCCFIFCRISNFHLFQLCRDSCYFRVSHSNCNSWLSGLDFLCLTSPKMPPRCLFTQLRLDESLPLWRHSQWNDGSTAAQKSLTVGCHSAVRHSKHLSFC